MLPWAMMPTAWITDGRIRQFRWRGSEGPNNVAALMTLAPILHVADRNDGIARITYDQLELSTSLSRTKISHGLQELETRGLIERNPEGRSTYALCDFDPGYGWAKFPALRLYREGQIAFFEELHLRKRAELDSLKLWYFLAARRDNKVNLAKVTYEQIAEETGVRRDRIKSAISLLAANGLVHVEHIPSRYSEHGVANAYRLPQIDSSRHMGSTGRGFADDLDLDEY